MSERAYLRPGFFVRRVFNPIARMFGTPSLVVIGRRSGREQAVPVNVLDFEGARYLVGIRGETEWVRNVRAADVLALRRRGKDERFSATELDDADKPRIIAAYLTTWGKQVNALFKQLPDPSDHPVFKLTPAT